MSIELLSKGRGKNSKVGLCSQTKPQIAKLGIYKDFDQSRLFLFY